MIVVVVKSSADGQLCQRKHCNPQKIKHLRSFEIDHRLFYLFHYPISDAELAAAEIQEGQRIGTFSLDEILTGELEGRPVVPHHLDILHWFAQNRS